MLIRPEQRNKTLIGVVGAIVAIALLFGAYGLWQQHEQNAFLEQVIDQHVNEIKWINHEVTRLKTIVAGLKSSVASTTHALEGTQQKNADLVQTLQAEQTKNNAFESQIRQISGTVGTLQKLSETDPELLKKYSKIYFLNENYMPIQLSVINISYLHDKDRTELIHSSVLPHLQALLEAAVRDGVTLQVVSAYRSFYDQVSVKTGYKMLYGAGAANQFSADQGYSEHQLGTTVDFTTPEAAGVFSKFEESPGYTWLTQNAYKFGFTLSYPKNNTYYQFEPWHWRFVGVALATMLHNTNQYFYTLTQREIDTYLISLFD